MADANILLVDTDAELVQLLADAMAERDYEVRVASTARSALDQAAVDDPDVVILDLALPDLDGIEVCQHLRRWSRAPIIVVSIDQSDDRKVRALDLGADDYLTKPFSLPELLARVRVALRHRRALASVVADDDIVVGSLRIDTAGHRAAVEGVELDLRPKEFALLTLLARNAGKVLTHRVLLDQVWGPGQAMDTLRTHVSLLRRKLGDHPAAPSLVTEPGVGYRLLRPDQD
jgi:two-component system KDP operon response regulator KdpE